MAWSSMMRPRVGPPCRVTTLRRPEICRRSAIRLSRSLRRSTRILEPRYPGGESTSRTAVLSARCFQTSTSRANKTRRQNQATPKTTTFIDNGTLSTKILTVKPTAVFSRPFASAVSDVTPYSALTVGVPRETYPDERRVALTPPNVALLLNKGFARVLVEHGAGTEAQFPDHMYERAGATMVDRKSVWAEADILLKVRAPGIGGAEKEIDAMQEGKTIISMLFPVQNQNTVDLLADQASYLLRYGHDSEDISRSGL